MVASLFIRRHGAGARVHADFISDRTVDDDHCGHGARRAAARAHAARRQGQDHRKLFRARARHHGIDRDFFNGDFPVLDEIGSSGCARLPCLLRLVCASISATRFSVGRTIGTVIPVIFQEPTMKFSSVWSPPPSRRALELDFLQMIAFGWAGQSFDDFLHHRPPADRALAFDVRS